MVRKEEEEDTHKRKKKKKAQKKNATYKERKREVANILRFKTHV